jgi:hypothetical protein
MTRAFTYVSKLHTQHSPPLVAGVLPPPSRKEYNYKIRADQNKSSLTKFIFPPSQIIRRLTFLTLSLTARLIKKMQT